MVKKAIFYLILFSVLFLTACSNDVNNTQTEDTQALLSENTAVSSDTYEVEYHLLTITSMNEYSTFLEKKSAIIPNFVSYTMIEELGEFKGITFLSNTSADDYSHYMYELCDPAGFTMHLYVDARNIPKSKNKTLELEQVNSQNLRMLLDKENGTFTCNGFEYQYVNGELLSIEWQTENLSFVLTGNEFLCDYPENKATPLSSLLTADTSSTAKDWLQLVFPE